MVFDEQVILGQIDTTLRQVKDLISVSQHGDISYLSDQRSAEAATLLTSAIERLAPPESSYVKNTKNCTIYGGPQGLQQSIKPLIGILNALRMAYENHYLQSIQELIHADVFSDMLEMAEHLLEQKYKDPSAVIIGSVLEEHLRKLALKHKVDTAHPNGVPKKADLLNSELASAGRYSKLDQKSVTSWLDLRNKAAHGHYSEYVTEQVSLTLQGVRDFIARCPA